MSTGADPKTQPVTVAYEEGYDRIYGADKKPTRGKWVWDSRVNKLVAAEEYVPPERACDAPIMVDRFYEGARASDGTDIGSRQKHRAYMKEHGLTTVDDFTETWKKDAARREQSRAGVPNPQRREQLGRALYEIEKRRK